MFVKCKLHFPEFWDLLMNVSVFNKCVQKTLDRNLGTIVRQSCSCHSVFCRLSPEKFALFTNVALRLYTTINSTHRLKNVMIISHSRRVL